LVAPLNYDVLANDENLDHAHKILKKQCQTFEVTRGLFHD
jgi:ribosomal protein S21